MSGRWFDAAGSMPPVCTNTGTGHGDTGLLSWVFSAMTVSGGDLCSFLSAHNRTGRDRGEQLTEIPGDTLTNGNQQYKDDGTRSGWMGGLRREGTSGHAFFRLQAAPLVLESVVWLFGVVWLVMVIRMLLTAAQRASYLSAVPCGGLSARHVRGSMLSDQSARVRGV